MFTTSRYSILLLASIFLLLNACSQDDGDGKDDGIMVTAALASEYANAKMPSVKCASSDELRKLCYLDLLKNTPELTNELGGRNPFLLRTWDQIDFSRSVLLKEVSLCRDSYPNFCG